MPHTAYNMTVDNIGNPEPFTIQSANVRVIRCFESEQAGTTAFKIRMPLINSPATVYPAGKVFELRNHIRKWSIGDVPFYIETVAGSVSFCCLEES